MKKKTPILPSLFHENKLVNDFREKIETFNSFFFEKMILIDSDSSRF